MVIDTLGSMPQPHFIDIKVEKKPEEGDTRAIEKSKKHWGTASQGYCHVWHY
jgi:hypothetical protein